ncbi:MAG TPA: RHS repeat-associated core domain-containing protein, partial [Saprospiraceae bacterium]|nr:RHS repeat-associated core domain-containing protein [Saprospiraceae bacterium]
RFYDSDLGRFLGVDPLASEYYSWSAYNYVLGNPISLIDKNGKNPGFPGGSNPLMYLAEGFRQYFQTAGYEIDKFGATLTTTFSKTIST